MKSNLLMNESLKAFLRSAAMERTNVVAALGFGLTWWSFKKISGARNSRISIPRYVSSSARMLHTSGYANRTVLVPAISPRRKTVEKKWVKKVM